MPDTPANSRPELSIIAGMTLVGAVLRFWAQGRLGLNHFDEGIYAISGLWSVTPKGLAGVAPELVSYAPPLYPILVGVLYLFLGVSDVSAILVSQLAGVLTIPAVAWVAWRTFGRGAGAAASVLVAISGPHICFSRMALTDSTFLLCWTLALGFGGRFLERPGILRAIPFGVMVGLAQNTKYNGYLAGGIVALTAVWGMVRPGDGGRKSAIRAIGYGVIAAIIALAVYWPWYRFVQSQPGGYAGLLKHHRSYLTGTTLFAWGQHWRLQMAQSYALSGSLIEALTWGIVAWPLAWIFGSFVVWTGRAVQPNEPNAKRDYWPGMRLRMGLILGLAVYGISPNAGWWVALGMMPWWLFDRSPMKRLLAIGWLVMAVLTPFYHPYARLWLPLHAFHWIALAGLVPAPNRNSDEVEWPLWSRRLRLMSFSAALFASVISDGVVEPHAYSLGSPIGTTEDLRGVCHSISLKMEFTPKAVNEPPGRLLVVARPVVVFYLSQTLEGWPIARYPDVNSMLADIRPGDRALIDWSIQTAQISNKATIRLDSFGNRVQPRYFSAKSPPTTAADIHPEAALDRQIYNRTQLTLYPHLRP